MKRYVILSGYFRYEMQLDYKELKTRISSSEQHNISTQVDLTINSILLPRSCTLRVLFNLILNPEEIASNHLSFVV